MDYNNKSIKVLRTQKLLETFTKKNSFILFFSCLDLSNKNLKELKITLKNKDINLIFIKKNFLKKILEPITGFTKIKKVINGPILIGVLSSSKGLYDLSLNLEKKHKVLTLGCFYNQELYSNSFVDKISKLDKKNIYKELVSVCLQKQILLTFILKSRFEKN
jgi:ribosomal protein L10